MNKFEAVLLVSPEISNSQLNKELENFENLLANRKGKLINKENWGLKDLSYSIFNFKKAFYKYFQIEINGNEIKNLSKNLGQNDKILRHLFIRVEKHQELPTKLINEKE